MLRGGVALASCSFFCEGGASARLDARVHRIVCICVCVVVVGGGVCGWQTAEVLAHAPSLCVGGGRGGGGANSATMLCPIIACPWCCAPSPMCAVDASCATPPALPYPRMHATPMLNHPLAAAMFSGKLRFMINYPNTALSNDFAPLVIVDTQSVTATQLGIEQTGVLARNTPFQRQ
jgi:hypothetical protein